MAFFLSILLTLLSLSAHAEETPTACEKGFAPLHSTEDLKNKIETRSHEVVETLLDPAVPDSIVEEFDYGSDPDPDILRSMRAAHLRTSSDPDALPMLDNFSTLTETNPVHLSTSAIRGNDRLSYLQGNFFSDGYYARHVSDPNTPKNSKWQSLLRDQPWIEFDTKTQKYSLRTTGATEKILNSVRTGSTVTLYRGTVPQEAEALRLIKEVSEAKSANAAIQKLEQLAKPGTHLQKMAATLLKQTAPGKDAQDRLLQSLSDDLQSGDNLGLGGLFTTPAADKANSFSKGAVVKYEVSEKNIQQLLKAQNIYAGIEDAVEINFHGIEGLRVLMASQVDVQSVKHDFNIFASQTSSIWRDPPAEK